MGIQKRKNYLAVSTMFLLFLTLLSVTQVTATSPPAMPPPAWVHSTDTGVSAVDVSADGSYIVMGTANKISVFSKDSNVSLWSYTTPDIVWSVSMSDDGFYILAGINAPIVNRRTIYFFNRTSSTPMWTSNTTGAVYSVDLSEDGKWGAAAADDGNLYYFNTTNKANPLKAWGNLFEMLRAVAISSNGSCLVVGTYAATHNYVYFFNTSSIIAWPSPWGSWMRQPVEGSVLGVAMSSNGIHAAALVQNHSTGMIIPPDVYIVPPRVYYFKVDEPPYARMVWWHRLDGRFTGLSGVLGNLAMSDDGTYLTAAGEDAVYFWNKTYHTPQWIFATGSPSILVYGLDISADGNYVSAGMSNNKTYMFSKSSVVPLWIYNTGGSGNAVSLSSDGSYLAVGTSMANRLLLFGPSAAGPPSGEPVIGLVPAVGLAAGALVIGLVMGYFIRRRRV